MLLKELFDACCEGNVKAVRDALCAGLDPNARYKGQTPLMYACETGNAAVAQLLIDNGAKVEAVDTYHRTALHLACKNVHVDCAAVLMAAGAKNDVECTLGGETPADIVHLKGPIEMVRTVMYFDPSQGSPVKAEKPSKSPIQRFDSPVRLNREPIKPRPVPWKRVVTVDDGEENSGDAAAGEETEAAPPQPESINEVDVGPAISIGRKAPPAEEDELRRYRTPPRRDV